jgi:acyl-[acyl-carrier-protein]-phospholipid O-acyltransferase/long-chain-fatty-acid--[acyl-carrier-protein] ligase
MDMTLHRTFIRNAKRLGGKLAIVDRARDKRITYSEALIVSLILAKKFRRYEKGFIGIMIPTGAGAALCSIAALMSGRVPVMINYSGDAAKNAKYAQDKCGFKTIITAKALIEKIGCPEIDGFVYAEELMASISIADKIKGLVTSKLPLSMLEATIHKGKMEDDAVILFTSGSEALPKAVQLTHTNISSNVDSVVDRLSLTEDDLFLANLPFFHVFGITANLWAPLNTGMTMVSYANPIDYRKICEIIKDEKVTLVAGTPSFLLGYLRKSEPGDFDSVRIFLAGADKCPDALRKGYLDKHNKVLFEAYGATETSPAVTVNSPEMNKPGSIGKPIMNVEVRIEHHETGEECATGEQGKILVKGPNIMKGYFDDLEETSRRIRDHWYDTGDMGYMDEDGYLWHTGRLKRFTKIGGEMISLVKVENALEKFLPDEVECCLVEIPDPVKGSRLVAATTTEIDKKAALKHMGKELSNIELPKEFVIIEELPKMGSGKIDFRTTTSIIKEMLKS